MKKNNHKKLIIASAAVIIAAGAGAAVYAASNASADSDTETGYREYSVSKGDITVGAEESGTVSIEREYVTFPCAAEVQEVCVKEGTTVKEGDLLLKLSPDDIADAKEELESAVTSAKLSLESVKQEQSEKLLEAKQTLESSLESGSTAESDYSLYITKSTASAQSLQKQLESLKKELAEYNELKETYPDDYAELCEYEDKLNDYQNKYKEMEKQYRAYQKIDSENSAALDAIKTEYENYTDKISDTYENITALKKNYDDAKTAYEKAQEDYDTAKENYDKANSSSTITVTDSTTSSDSTSTSGTTTNTSDLANKLAAAKTALEEAASAYNSANVAYSGYYQKLGSEISDTIDDYEEKVAAAEKVVTAHEKITQAYKEELDDFNSELSDVKEEYEDKRSDFTDVYGQNDADSIDDKIDSLNDSISETELSIQTTEAESGSDLLKARQDADTAIAKADSAQSVYDQTAASLENQVSEAQKKYDDAVKEYEEFCDSVSDDGSVYAECDGIISSVNVSDGDSIMANVSLVTIMDTRYIYLSASVSEEDITSLESDMECSVSLTAFDGKSFTGHIDTISAEPARSSGSVTYTVTVKLDDESGLNVREGMSGDITFIEGGVTDVMYTNVNAVTFRDGKSYVKVYDENGQVIEKEVTTGFSDGRYVEITSGVSAGEKLLAEIQLSGK